MASEHTQRFIDALLEAEQARSPDPVAALFVDGAELTRLGLPPTATTPDAFWRDYLAAFETVRSHFSLVVEAGPHAVLEWHSEGTRPGGRPVTYAGVSLLEWAGDKVARFRTYYDSAAFAPATPAAT